MSGVELFIEAIKYILPAGVVAITGWYLLQSQQRKENVQEVRALRADVLKQNLPLKLSAYERAILFLERIQPQNLLPRLNAPGLTVQDYRLLLIQGIREEYEHNIAQQLYISHQAWNALAQAKEEILSLVNEASQGLPPEDEGVKLGKRILEIYGQKESNPAQKAIFMLKQDILPFFGMPG